MLYIETKQFQEEARTKSMVWDREWCRYFAEKNSSRGFFSDMSSPDRRLWIDAEELRKYTKRDFYFANIFGEYAPEVWISPSEIIGKNVFELGCGPATFGKIAGKICTHYFGVDYSRLALHIAEIVSPPNCTFFHISQTDKITALRGKLDTVISRHFFIHQNVLNIRWILELYAYVLRNRGRAVLDFWPYGPDTKMENVTIREGHESLCATEPSCVYYFREAEIEHLVNESGFSLIDGIVVREVNRRFITIEKKP